MKTIHLGDTVIVRPGEEFAVEWRKRTLSGVTTKTEFPTGIVKVRSESPRPAKAGGAPIVHDVFRCTRRGTFKIKYEAGRPWEPTTATADVTVSCD